VTRADRVTAALLLALAVTFSAGALKFYPYSSEGGPGSGFLPFWLGAVMAALSLLMLLRRPRSTDTGLEWLPDRAGAIRVIAVVAATIAFVALLNFVGMVLGTALYLAALIRFLGQHRWWVTLAVAAGAAGFNYLVFARWLRVPFPEGMLWIF
jgi:hypothetical protein